MEISSINNLCDVPSFIEFAVNIKGKIVNCRGEEYYCRDLECNCCMANLMFYEVGEINDKLESGKRMAHILYGWRPYKYYVKEGFFKSDCEKMVLGSLDLREAKNPINEAVEKGFRLWLAADKNQKDQIFMQRYEQFRQKLAEENTAIPGNRDLSAAETQEVIKGLSLSDLFDLIRKNKL
jgi:hypothetical protein